MSLPPITRVSVVKRWAIWELANRQASTPPQAPTAIATASRRALGALLPNQLKRTSPRTGAAGRMLAATGSSLAPRNALLPSPGVDGSLVATHVVIEPDLGSLAPVVAREALNALGKRPPQADPSSVNWHARKPRGRPRPAQQALITAIGS
jgi:hypothetical protein